MTGTHRAGRAPCLVRGRQVADARVTPSAPAALTALAAAVRHALTDSVARVRPPLAVTGPAFAGPAFAGVMWSVADGPRPGVRLRRADHAHETAVLDGPAAPRPRPGHHGRATGEPAAPGDRPDLVPPGGTDPPAGLDAEHAEVWGWVQRAQRGDGEAFGLLYDRYVDSVFRFIYYRVNDRALAEDFTSETFVRALRRISTISYQGRDIGAWFVTIARNIVLDHVKSARNRLEVTTADTLEGRERAESTETIVLGNLTSERLLAAVGELGDEQRECVMLRFMQGLSVSETAAVMGKNDGAIKALQHRAVRKLAELVGDDLR